MDKNVITPEEDAKAAEEAEMTKFADEMAAEEAKAKEKEQISLPEAKAPAIESKDFVRIFTHPLFLVSCILLTVSFAFSLEMTDGFGLFTLLFIIGMWVAYGRALGGKSPLGGMKLFAGTLSVCYVLNYVLAAILLLTGVA